MTSTCMLALLLLCTLHAAHCSLLEFGIGREYKLPEGWDEAKVLAECKAECNADFLEKQTACNEKCVVECGKVCNEADHGCLDNYYHKTGPNTGLSLLATCTNIHDTSCTSVCVYNGPDSLRNLDDGKYIITETSDGNNEEEGSTMSE